MRINIGNLQVSGYQKKAVYTIWIILNLGIDNTGINIGCDFFTTEQLIKVFGNFRRSCLDNFSDYLIAAGGLPECFRKAVVRDIIDYRPWIKDFCIAKTISIVPFAELIIFIVFSIVSQHVFYLFFSKTKIRAVAIIENRIGFQIVHAAEDTFLCYTQYSCKKAKCKVWIVLESS